MVRLTGAELSIQGDAPKDFVRLREQEPGTVSSGRRRRRISRRTSKWRPYIAKQTIDDAIAGRFPEEHANIMRRLVEMISFDALVGNNDRHPANWGIVVELKGARAPRFSPVFDTARGLFWNYTEHIVSKTLANPKMLESYIGRSAPQIGWDDMGKVSHFDLVQPIAENHPQYRDCLAKYAAPGFVDNAGASWRASLTQ